MSENEGESLEQLGALGKSMGQEQGGADAVAERVAPGWIKFMPPLVRELWNKGVEFTMDGQSGEIHMTGFYKQDPVKLDLREDGIVAIDKRARETNIKSFEDLVDLNYKFWRQANSRKGVYVQPTQPWLGAFLEKKKVKRQVLFVPVDDGEDEDDL